MRQTQLNFEQKEIFHLVIYESCVRILKPLWKTLLEERAVLVSSVYRAEPGCAYDLSLASAVRSEEPDTDPALDLPGLRLSSKLDFRPDLR